MNIRTERRGLGRGLGELFQRTDPQPAVAPANGLPDPAPLPDLWLRDDPGHAGEEAWPGRFWDSPDLWVRNKDDGGLTRIAQRLQNLKPVKPWHLHVQKQNVRLILAQQRNRFLSRRGLAGDRHVCLARQKPPELPAGRRLIVGDYGAKYHGLPSSSDPRPNGSQMRTRVPAAWCSMAICPRAP